MNHDFHRIGRSITGILLMLTAMTAQSAMQELTDQELANVTGQAMLSVDALTYKGFQYTRINIGADIDLLTNIDEVRLGNYPRNDLGTVSDSPADIWVDNFALGRIDNANSMLAKVVPFKIQDPYIEFAFTTNDNGVRELAGLRLGFGKAQGDMSGDMNSMTGVLQGKITGSITDALVYYRENNLQTLCMLDPACATLQSAAILGGDLTGEVQLINGKDGATSIAGQPINRADHIGLAKGDYMHSNNALVEAIMPLISRNNGDCTTSGLPACFPLNLYKSIFIGDPTKDIATGGAKGIFLSLQNQNVPWQDLAQTNKFIETQSGAFVNMAKYGTGAEAVYPFLISLYDALHGTSRVPTCIGANASGC